MGSTAAVDGLSWRFTPYVLPLLGAAALCLALAFMAWRRRRIPGGLAFAVLMFAIGEWALTYALEMAGTNLTTKLFVERPEYLGIVACPISALIFALQYTGRGHWLTPARFGALALIPVITLVLVWVDPTHGPVQAAVRIGLSGPVPALVVVHGPWFWIHTAYAYLLLGVAAILLLESVLRSPKRDRSQIVALLVGIFTPLISNVLHLAGVNPVPRLDLTPFAFTVTGLAMFVAFFRLGFLDRFIGLPLVARNILISRLPDAMILVDSRGAILDANPVALGVLGLPEARVVGQPVSAFLPDWDEWTLRSSKPRPRQVEITLGPKEAPGSYDLLLAPEYVGGTALVGWVLVLREITERKRIEDALQQSERRFRLLIERSSDVFLILGQDAILRYVSPSVQSVLGYAPETLVGTNCLDFVHPDDVPQAIAALGGVAREQGAPLSTLIRCRRGDGVWRWFESIGVNLLSEPAVGGIVATMRDVTERQQIQADLEEALARAQAARAEAEAAVRLRDDFLSIAAHELKTPITSLRLATQALPRVLDRGFPADSPQFRRGLQTIDEQSVKLAHLVLQLLEISRLRLGRLSLNRSPANLVDLVQRAVDQAQLRTANHQLVLTAPAEAMLLVDALRFEQVMTNLLDNAIKYSPNGGPIEVAIASPTAEQVSVTVCDHGIGIPPDRRDQIFNLFYQAHPESHQSGMGVGLFIARQIVELHEGRIQVEFPSDGGTCFRVDLPVNPPAPPTRKGIMSPTRNTWEDAMELAERMTQRQARPGEVAVEVLRANQVDVVFGLNGEHVLGLYQALSQAPEIRHVTVKHENNAAIAAEAYGRLTGRPGVVTVTAGPGATNSLSGVAGAYATGSPLVHLSGGVPLGADLESFHGVDDPEVLDRAFSGATKWTTRVTDPREVASALTRAFGLAVAGRPGPVHVELARNVLDGGPIPAAEVKAAPAPPAEPSPDLDELIAAVTKAERIGIVAGKGAWWPEVSQELPGLADALGAPVAHTWDGHAAMPTNHPLNLGMWRGDWSHPEIRAYLKNCDLVLGVGVRPGTEAARALPGACGGTFIPLMAADAPDPSVGPTIPSMASLAATLRALAENARRPTTAEARDACARQNQSLKAALAAELKRVGERRPWHVGLAIAALAERMTADHVVVSDVSNVKLWMPLQLPVYGPHSHVQASTWGEMGYALPAAMGAAFARPGQKVVALTGDTSFLMSSSDFVTLCQWKLPIVMAVHHDGQIGMIHNMFSRDGQTPYATSIGDVDFARYAEAHGALGIRVSDPADLGAAWDRALAADGPVLLELMAGHDFAWPRVPRMLEENQI